MAHDFDSLHDREYEPANDRHLFGRLRYKDHVIESELTMTLRLYEDGTLSLIGPEWTITVSVLDLARQLSLRIQHDGLREDIEADPYIKAIIEGGMK